MRTSDQNSAHPGTPRRARTCLLGLALVAAAAGCQTAEELSQSSTTIEPQIFEPRHGANAGEGLTIFPGCWETVGQEMRPTLVRGAASSTSFLEFGFRVEDPSHRGMINVPARARLDVGSLGVSDWVGSFLIGPVREASETSIPFYRQDSQYKLVDFHAWPVVLRPSILSAVHIVRRDQVLGQAADPARARFTVWVELDPLEEHLTYDPRPYRVIEFTPAVRSRGAGQAEVHTRRLRPGSYRGPVYWGADTEVEVYEVSVQFPESAPGSASILEVQVESGGDVEHARIQF